MNALLAFISRPAGGTAPVSREWAEASDWCVLFTLGTLFFLLGAFAASAWIIWRRTTRPQPHMQLLMELENDEAAEPASKPAAAARETSDAPPAPWEQPADWWKKGAEE